MNKKRMGIVVTNLAGSEVEKNKIRQYLLQAKDTISQMFDEIAVL